MTDPSIENQKSKIQNEDDVTGLPLLHSWRELYAFVLTAFILYVILLYALTGTFS